MSPDVLLLPGVRCYVGDVGGQPVTSGLGVTLGAFTGLFSIATLPAYRGRGYGTAMTARMVADGLAAGAKWSWLQSSPAGYPIYDRLGFRTVESWPRWLSTT
jgi:GNAT superfamily N-acetyltransferase